MLVEEIDPEQTHDLRRRVLRQHLPEDEVDVDYLTNLGLPHRVVVLDLTA